MKKILTLIWLLLILCGGQIMLAQTANADIYAVARGDLWKYDGADGSGRRLTRSGYNGGPVLSPDGRRFAFMQTAARFIAQFRSGSTAQRSGTPPADIWTYDIATSAYRQIADQTGASSAGFIRSLPAWSPDSQKLAWLQLDPAAQPLGRASLVVYDMASDRASLVADEIDLGYQSGDIVMPELRWGMAGIARLLFTFQHGAQNPVTVLELVQPTTGETLRFDLGLADGENARVDDFMWGEHLGRHIILLRQGERWEALDPLLGTRSRLSAPPRLKNRFVAGGIELMPIAVSAEGKWQIHWHALAQGVIYATGFVSGRVNGGRQPALSSDGMAAAWHDGAALHVWRGGDEAIGAAEAADMPEFPIPGPVSLAWSPMIWSATGEAATAQAVATAEPQASICELPAQLTPGQTAVVSPGLANRVRSGASLNAGVIGRIAPGEVVYVLGGPICAHGYHWYEIQNEIIRGWTVEGADANYWLLYFVDCADSPPIRLGVGMSAVVTPGKANNIRSGPGVNGTAILGKVGAGEQLDIMGFPICDASGLRWFPMRFGELEGWTAAGQGDEYWIEPAE